MAEQPHNVEAVNRYLDEQGVDHEVVEHPEKFSAASEARASGVPPEDAAKSVMLRDRDGFVLAVVPASERLDLSKVRDLLGRELRLATEEELGEEFPLFQLGAVPPLGPGLPAAEIVDQRLTEHEQVLCSGGDHGHAVLLDPQEIVRVSGAQVADVCED